MYEMMAVAVNRVTGTKIEKKGPISDAPFIFEKFRLTGGKHTHSFVLMKSGRCL